MAKLVELPAKRGAGLPSIRDLLMDAGYNKAVEVTVEENPTLVSGSYEAVAFSKRWFPGDIIRSRLDPGHTKRIFWREKRNVKTPPNSI